MNDFVSRLAELLVPGKRVHLIGIGGVSMRPLGLVLSSRGIRVTGSDMNASVSTNDLINAGIPVFVGHKQENVIGADCIIRTAAVHNDNPEIQAARENGIPVFERAQAWGYIMSHYRDAVCVSGTHGKTTTTGMISHIAMAAEADPTIMIGGMLPLLNAGHRVGKGELIIAESCEYCNSFLNFFPTVAVINNIEEDHLDFFKDLKDIQKSFRAFAELVPDTGAIIVNGDDANTLEALSGLNYKTFGLKDTNDYYAANINSTNTEFDVIHAGQVLVHIELKVYGRHNVYNAVAACAVADYLGFSAKAMADGLSTFRGAARRMEFKGEYNGAAVFDDYAHHPGELHALLTTCKELPHSRIICAFQPHTYSRTAALFDSFVEELKQADIAVLAEIYAARESNQLGISSNDLCKKIPNALYCPTLPSVTQKLKELAQPGDLILTVGAGDIYKAGEALLR